MTTPVSGVTGTTATAATATDSSTSSSSSASMLDPQAFLQLLVAQLQYQDPTNPTDTSTFMNQTAMLSQVQTMNSMNSTLTALSTAQQAQSATTLIGKQVTWADSSGATSTGIVTSATLGSSGATLQVGGVSVPLASVSTVTNPA